jgi:DNA-directed RNA polymerase subunit RPC12/RpoP
VLSSSLSKINIKELGLTDQEAIDFVRKLRSIGQSVYYMTDGASESFILGKFGDEIPIATLALKQKIESLEKRIENIETTMQELKALKSIETLSPKIGETKTQVTTQTKQEEITLPPLPSLPDLPKEEPPKLGFKSRLEESQEITQTISPTIPMQTVTFKCPSCSNVFSENVPKDKKIIEVRCPQCGFIVYKKKVFWTKRKIVTVAGLAVLAFIIWLFLL